MNKKFMKVFSLALVVTVMLTTSAFAANKDSRSVNVSVALPQNVSVSVLPINNYAPVTVTTNDYVPVFQANSSAPVIVTTNDHVPVSVNDAQVPITISLFSKLFKLFK